MAGLQSPLSTLRHTPHDTQRMTRGQCGLLFLHCTGLSPATPCRSPGALAYINFRFVKCPQVARSKEALYYLSAGFLFLQTGAYSSPCLIADWQLLRLAGPPIALVAGPV